MSGVASIWVETTPAYEVVVGHHLLDRLPALVDGARQVAVLHPEAVRATAEEVEQRLTAHGCQVHLIRLPAGEAAKTADVATSCWAELDRIRLTRSDAVVGVGGGASTDLAGFVAATWLRGVPVVHVPTTLLGMVDAALGGKTGINTAGGKNLVGSFHQPAGVVCDLATLDSLPPADLIAGLAEVVKCGFVADPTILDLLERPVAEVIDVRGDVLPALVERAVRVKASVVAADPRETVGSHGTNDGAAVGRAVLNYGHTLGHAIEQVERYQWRHGEAVSVGLVFAATVSQLAGRLDAATARRHANMLARLGLPVSYRADAWPALRDAMGSDKKKGRAERLRLVVLDGLAQPALLSDPDPALLAAAYAEVSAGPPGSG